jgi:hypothetical protein
VLFKNSLAVKSEGAEASMEKIGRQIIQSSLMTSSIGQRIATSRSDTRTAAVGHLQRSIFVIDELAYFMASKRWHLGLIPINRLPWWFSSFRPQRNKVTVFVTGS